MMEYKNTTTINPPSKGGSVNKNVGIQIAPPFKPSASVHNSIQPGYCCSSAQTPPAIPNPDYLNAAIQWFRFGFKVIPISPGTKRPAVKYEHWLTNLSEISIRNYWTYHKNHEVGFVTGDDIIVFDVDTEESKRSLNTIENTFKKPNLITKTKKGEHHFFRISRDVYAKSDSHDSENYPEKIDIKTGNGIIVLPPSTDKSVLINNAASAENLVEIDQLFVDAIFLMNSREVPRPTTPNEDRETVPVDKERIIQLLKYIDSDCGYEDWLRVGMAIFNSTGGSDEGRTLFDQWSKKGHKYKGSNEILTKWRSFRPDVANPVTIGTLIKMAKEAGANVATILGERFEDCRGGINLDSEATRNRNPLDDYSLLGMSGEIEKLVMAEIFVLPEIALLGQATAIYAAPNTGKTLLSLALLQKCIQQGSIDPTKVYYINVDDTHSGLLEKLHYAEEYGFHMLAEGCRGFEAKHFLTHVTTMVDSDTAHGVIIFLDTLKKFTDLMDKKNASHFTSIIRQFVMKGGTVIALAHTNKNRGKNGQRIAGGTSDIVDDFDCIYILDTVSTENGKKAVEFTNRKRRGNVINSTCYSYDTGNNVTYNELLLSVAKVDENQLISLRQAKKEASDTEIILAIEACIKDGINTKMKLAEAAAQRAGISKRQALKMIEKYTSDDSTDKRWTFEVKERGAKVYVLPNRSTNDPNNLDIT